MADGGPRSACLGENAKDPDALLSGVFEFWQRLNRFLGRSGQYELAILLLQLAHWNSDVMPTEADKPPAPMMTKETAVSGAMMRSSIFPTR